MNVEGKKSSFEIPYSIFDIQNAKEAKGEVLKPGEGKNKPRSVARHPQVR